MGNMLATLEYETSEIRMVGTVEKPEWIAADICGALGISNPSDSVQSFRDSEIGIATIYTNAGPREMITVTEPGFYRLVLKSRKPEAERFRVWVTHEVLPTIRKFGCYPAPTVEIGETAVVQMDGRALAREFGAVVGREIRSAVSPIAEKVDRVDIKVDLLDHRVSQIEKRKNIPDKIKRRHLFVVKNYYSGKCPCCRQTLIVNSAGERLAACQFDHWDRPSEIAVGKTWAVCSDCNQSLRDADWKHEKSPQFNAYQQCRREQTKALRGELLPGVDEE